MIENMGIGYDEGDDDYIMSCDNCDKTLTSMSGFTFDEVIKEARDEGWLIHKDKDGDWEHLCPSCKDQQHEPA